MLIIDGKLDMTAFKELFSSIQWTKLPRELGPNHKDFFYVGHYEDSEKRVNIKVRPSKIMAVAETFKNRMPNDGSIPPETYKGQTVDWGTTIEVQVNDSILKRIQGSSSELAQVKVQEVSWE